MKTIFYAGCLVLAIVGSVKAQSADARAFAESLDGRIESDLAQATNIFQRDYSNDFVECIWNDWEDRDEYARDEGTFYNCRYLFQKKSTEFSKQSGG